MSLASILAFNPSNQLAVRRAGTKTGLAFTGADLPAAVERMEAHFKNHTVPALRFTNERNGMQTEVYLAQVTGTPADHEVHFVAIEQLLADRSALAPTLAAVLDQLDPYLIEVPYLHLGENDFIYKFRPDKERNRLIYQLDDHASSLYQSGLCTAIKALSRTHERSAAAPTPLDFGAVRYLIPSHFGFCLGVKNAIERAYETLAENPVRRVFMLSELIHNPFVNEDLLRRGLRYLQTDKGAPISVDGKMLWDTLTPEDIVIIPAFGATDEDKRRLVRKGIPVLQYDATCMLVEKVWKAARAFGREGYTIIIHGKHEHEETKATFSNARRHAPALIVRNLDEARILTEVIHNPEHPEAQARFDAAFEGKHTPGFDISRDLQRVAVVNQTTLLMNETLTIIEHLQEAYKAKYGAEEAANRVGGNGKRDTLCYATQVNQDALARALAEPLDAAFVVGGKNSSNTYQLYRLCKNQLGDRAFFIQSESSIRDLDTVEHYLFPAHAPKGSTSPANNTELRVFPKPQASDQPLRILITGGASCPDGIIQQVITRINSLLPSEKLRSMDAVLADLNVSIS